MITQKIRGVNKKQWLVMFCFAAGIAACNKEIAEQRFLGFQVPENFPAPAYHFATNSVTKDGFELGRKLFYDPILSANNTISCSSCHIQTAAFVHNGHPVSHGILDRLGTRNSPPIMNLAWSTSFMWDGGVADLDLQPIAPITNHVEMDDSVSNVIARLQSSTIYPALFKKAFGSSEITTAGFLKALSQFMVMCVSSNAKYDSVQRQQALFTADEQQGYLVYKKKCSSCHSEPLFTDNSFRNNGLAPSGINDMGRYAITLNEADRYMFKVPGLRNLVYTAPYMHDGRLLTLNAVLDHYTSQVQPTQNLDALFTQNGKTGIEINNEERTQLMTFLKTLTDRSFVTDKRLAAP